MAVIVPSCLAPTLAVVDRRLAGVVEALASGVRNFTGRPVLLGQQRGEQEEGLVAGVAAAELAAHVGADHPHLCSGRSSIWLMCIRLWSAS